MYLRVCPDGTQEIKSSLKFTKMNEMQVQIKTYLSESRRLQKYIEFSEAKRRQESNSVYNAANWKMLHGRLQSLMKENEIMSTQLGNAVEVLVGYRLMFSLSSCLSHQCGLLPCKQRGIFCEFMPYAHLSLLVSV